MPKFSYRLQPVLNVKEQTENAAKNELGKQIHRLDEANKQLQYMYSALEQCHSNIQNESAKGIIVSKLRQYSSYLVSANTRIKQQKENIEKIHDDVDKCREELIKVAKEKKILETLKDKKMQEYSYEQLKLEEKQTDEVVSYRYGIK